MRRSLDAHLAFAAHLRLHLRQQLRPVDAPGVADDVDARQAAAGRVTWLFEETVAVVMNVSFTIIYMLYK